VKRLFAWVAGAAGGLAAYRAVKGKQRPEPQRQPDAVADARAEELKERLQQAREAAEDRNVESAEAPVERAETLDPQARRAQVHEQGRAALDEMRGDQPS
jgi:hypothetical protein